MFTMYVYTEPPSTSEYINVQAAQFPAVAPKVALSLESDSVNAAGAAGGDADGATRISAACAAASATPAADVHAHRTAARRRASAMPVADLQACITASASGSVSRGMK